MRRKTFDALLTAGGLVLAAVLVVVGLVGLWAHNFIDNQVKTQLSQQQIIFPAAGSAAISDPAIKPYMTKYAGQQMTTGAQAETLRRSFHRGALAEDRWREDVLAAVRPGAD